MYGREGEELSLAAAGDAIITRRLSACEVDRFRDVVSLVRGADASIVNLEVMLHDYEGYPAAEAGGTYMRAPPWAADELAWMGFSAFAAATNHTGDYSHGGMEATMRELEARELPYAGLGRTLATAREPAYVDTAAGRVALVAACSTITPGTEAGEQRPDLHGRPGLSPLHVETTYVVPPETYEAVRSLATDLGLEAVKDHRRGLGFPVPGDEEDGFTFWNVDGEHLTFEEGDDFAVKQEADEDDVAAITDQIRAASRQADWVVASLHNHQGAGGLWNDHSNPAFAESFARACVDAGADAFLGHGAHVLRGIEVYGGAPVFYGLGDFVMENETVTRLPAELYDRYDLGADALPADLFDARVFETADGDGEDEGDPGISAAGDGGRERIGFLGDAAFWESVLPVCNFEGGALSSIELHPLDLGYEAPRPRRGRPLLADDETGAHILDTLGELSDPYGTEIEVEDGTGVIRV